MPGCADMVTRLLPPLLVSPGPGREVQNGMGWSLTEVRKARANVADALDAADVFLYRDSSVAPLLDMRRWFKAVVDVLGGFDSLCYFSFAVGGACCSMGYDSCSRADVSCYFG